MSGLGIDFKTCPKCNGYGVLDSGRNCRECGGSGTGGLHSTNGVIGSGEIMVDSTTKQKVSHAEFYRRVAARDAREGAL